MKSLYRMWPKVTQGPAKGLWSKPQGHGLSQGCKHPPSVWRSFLHASTISMFLLALITQLLLVTIAFVGPAMRYLIMNTLTVANSP